MRGSTRGRPPLIDEYDTRLDVGVRVFYRETTQDPGSEMCPIALDAEIGASESEIATLLDAQADHAADVDAELKIDAPLAETIASAVEALGDTGRRVIVLITTSIPDTRTVIDSLCGMDPAVAAAQAARAEGVEVYVLGLEKTTTSTGTSASPRPSATRASSPRSPTRAAAQKWRGLGIECEGTRVTTRRAAATRRTSTPSTRRASRESSASSSTKLLAACDP